MNQALKSELERAGLPADAVNSPFDAYKALLRTETARLGSRAAAVVHIGKKFPALHSAQIEDYNRHDRFQSRHAAASAGQIPFECRFHAQGGGNVQILLFDKIGKQDDGSGVSAMQVALNLQRMEEVKSINVRINSTGGDIMEAVGIYNALERHPARKIVDIEGYALSAASLVAMAGGEIRIVSSGVMMIHNCWGLSAGNAADLRKLADECDVFDDQMVGIYANRTGQSQATIRQWLDEETWFYAEEAVQAGFADRVVNSARQLAAKARIDLSRFRNAPQLARR